MKIYVCVKHVPDSAATIAIQSPTEIDESVTFLLNPYDENAVEAAAQIKTQVPGSEIIAVTLGKADAAQTLRSALAMGADRGVHITVDRRIDSILTARALSAAIQREGEPGMVFTGKVAIDSEGYETMFRLAAALDLPAVTNVVALEFNTTHIIADCELEAGRRQTLKVPLPCVIGAAKALNKPRYPTLPDIMKARKKKIATLVLEDLCLAGTNALEIEELVPAVEQRRGRILKGTAQEAVDELIRLLKTEAKVIE